MKRDLELLRQLLIEVEQLPGKDWTEITIPGHTGDEIVYHAHLAADQGLLEAKFAPRDMFVLFKRLTYDGHEFLDAARSDTVWAKAKEHVLQTTGTLTIEALKGGLALVMKQLIGG